MTGRRSLQTFTERMSRQTQFVPGHVGGRVASAQPVKRRHTIGQTEQREALPLYWWKFDDASGDSVEAGGGPPIVWSGTPIYQAAALAPGSNYGIDLNNAPESSFATGEASFSTTLSPGADGLIVIDWWMADYMSPTSTATTTLLSLRKSATTVRGLAVRCNGVTDELEVRIGNGTTTVTVDSIASPASPGHLRWEVDPIMGTSRLLINGTDVSNVSGLTVGWDAGAWLLQLGAADNTTNVWDELKIYGTSA